jgi:hypothetical protein
MHDHDVINMERLPGHVATLVIHPEYTSSANSLGSPVEFKRISEFPGTVYFISFSCPFASGPSEKSSQTKEEIRQHLIVLLVRRIYSGRPGFVKRSSAT